MCSSTEKIQEIYKAFIQESGIQFSELEEKVLQFHLSNLEYACGSNLSQVSFDSCVLKWVSFTEDRVGSNTEKSPDPFYGPRERISYPDYSYTHNLLFESTETLTPTLPYLIWWEFLMCFQWDAL